MAELAEAPQEPPSRRGRPLTFAQTKCVQLLREKEDQQNLKAVFSVWLAFTWGMEELLQALRNEDEHGKFVTPKTEMGMRLRKIRDSISKGTMPRRHKARALLERVEEGPDDKLERSRAMQLALFYSQRNEHLIQGLFFRQLQADVWRRKIQTSADLSMYSVQGSEKIREHAVEILFMQHQRRRRLWAFRYWMYGAGVEKDDAVGIRERAQDNARRAVSWAALRQAKAEVVGEELHSEQQARLDRVVAFMRRRREQGNESPLR